MMKTGLLAAACRAALVLGVMGAVPYAASAAVIVVQDVDAATTLVQNTILQAQREAASAGLTGDAAASYIQSAVTGALAANGISPAVGLQAIANARANLSASGQLSPAAAAAVTSLSNAGAPTGGGAPASGGQNGSAPLGAPSSAGGGGGGGSDYRPPAT